MRRVIRPGNGAGKPQNRPEPPTLTPTPSPPVRVWVAHPSVPEGMSVRSYDVVMRRHVKGDGLESVHVEVVATNPLKAGEEAMNALEGDGWWLASVATMPKSATNHS